MIRRRLLLVLAGPLLVLGACGSDEADISTATPAAALAQAADAYEEAGSARMTMTMSMSGLPEVGDVAIEAEGAFDASGQGFMRMDMSALFDAVPSSQLGGVDLGDGVIEARVTEDAAYLRFSMLTMLLGGGAEWIRMPADELDAGGSGSFLPGGDPAQLLEILGGAGELETVGTEDVRGVETTHYRGAFDIAAAAEQLPEDERAAFDEAMSAIGDAPSFPADVWLDGDGLVRRLSMTVDGSQFGGLVPGAAGAGDVAAELVLELYDYGEELEPVEAPVDYIDASDLGGFGGLGGFGQPGG